MNIFVDADACPTKLEAHRVAKRYKLPLYFVSNSWLQVPSDHDVHLIVVQKQFDAVDNWIVAHAKAGDIVISSDIPLASRCLKTNVRVLDYRGRIFTEDSIGDALASRDLNAYLRDMGILTGGPAPFDKKDRSRFLQNLDAVIQAALREKKQLAHS